MALVEEQRNRLINFTFHSYAHLFETTRRDIYCQYPIPERRSWMDIVPGASAAIRKTRILYHAVRAGNVLHERFPVFGERVTTLRDSPEGDITLLDGPEVQEQIEPARVVFVYGWRLQTPALVERHANKIRAYFQPVEQFEEASRRAVEQLRQKADVVVGVHIRMGDIRVWRGGMYFFPPERYAGWMRELVEQFPARKVAFLICSDEPGACGDFGEFTVGFGPGSALGDMYSLAKCDYVFGAVSTFSQWASFYGGKPLFHLYNKTDRLRLQNFRVSYLDVPSRKKLLTQPAPVL